MEGDEAGGKERGGRAQRHKQERYTRKGKTRGTRRLHHNTENTYKVTLNPKLVYFLSYFHRNKDAYSSSVVDSVHDDLLTILQ